MAQTHTDRTRTAAKLNKPLEFEDMDGNPVHVDAGTICEINALGPHDSKVWGRVEKGEVKIGAGGYQHILPVTSVTFVPAE